MKLESKHPVLAMPMNGVSTASLAVSVYKAGAFPSISIFNYYLNGRADLVLLAAELKEFQNKTGSSNIMISMLWEEFLNQEIIDLLKSLKIKHVELFVRPVQHPAWDSFSKHIDQMRQEGFYILFKSTKILPHSNFDAIILKGPNGAGRTFEKTPALEESFSLNKEKIGADKLIPSGGIGSSKEARFYLDQGALAIGIGSLIAASVESCVSKETKQRIIESTSKNITNIGPLNCRGLLFSRLDNDDDNNSRSLRAGIKGTSSGCIYMGNGIDHITSIMPVKDIIENLIQC